jgi:rubrerythrin
MKKFKDINEILDFAISAEQRAVDLYTGLSERAVVKDMKDVFMQFAREEMGHKARLLKIKEEGILDLPEQKVNDLKISDYTGDVAPRDDMDYSEALVLAMSQEKAAFKLYSTLAERSPTEQFKNLFNALAQEEARHKLRFELEYDEYVLRDN